MKSIDILTTVSLIGFFSWNWYICIVLLALQFRICALHLFSLGFSPHLETFTQNIGDTYNYSTQLLGKMYVLVMVPNAGYCSDQGIFALSITSFLWRVSQYGSTSLWYNIQTEQPRSRVPRCTASTIASQPLLDRHQLLFGRYHLVSSRLLPTC